MLRYPLGRIRLRGYAKHWEMLRIGEQSKAPNIKGSQRLNDGVFGGCESFRLLVRSVSNGRREKSGSSPAAVARCLCGY